MAYQRYRFERRFGAPPPEEPVAEPEPVDPLDEPQHSERALRAAVDEARRAALAEGGEQGRREGEAAARTRLEGELAAGVGTLLGRLDALEADHRALMERVRDEGAALMVALTGRLAPRLLSATARDTLERLAGDVLRAAGTASELTLRVHPDGRDGLDAAVRAAAVAAGCKARIAVVSDPGLPAGALDAAWDAGGLHHSPTALDAVLSAAVDDAMAVLLPAATDRSPAF